MKIRKLKLSGTTIVLVSLAVVAATAATTAGVYCKFYADCHIGSRGSVNDYLGHGSGETNLPPGFHQEVLARDLQYPTDLAALPTGGVLVAEKLGEVMLVQPGAHRVRTVLDLRARVNSTLYRGIVAVRADPNFTRNRRFYVIYTNRGDGSAKPTTVTVSRFVLGPTSATTLKSEHVVLGAVRSGSCLVPGTAANCLPAEVDHIGAEIVFGRDGSLFISTGDGGGLEQREPAAYLSQNLDSLAGKVLHVDENGNGLPDNPWWNGKPRSNRSRIWAIGLRNPFRMVGDPRSNVLYVTDVGWRRWDELSTVRAGDNLGWPCLEGPVPAPPTYSRSKPCVSFDAAETTKPLLSFKHPGYIAVVGGGFATSASLPGRFRGAYFFGDWVRGVIKYTHIAADGSRATPPIVFAQPVAGPTAIVPEPDGSILYTAANAGQLRRIFFSG